MNQEEPDYAPMFKALGDPTRLRIFQYLRSCCCGRAAVDTETGEAHTLLELATPTVGEVCCRVTGSEKITSSLSVHLKELRTAGLIRMERRGKHFLCSIEPQALALLTQFFTQEPTPQKENSNHGCC